MEGAHVLTLTHDSLPLLFPIFLYAETHYRFRFFFSYLKKAEPEIIADTPHRIEPGKLLPILLLIKDANRFPVVLRSVTLRAFQLGKLLLTENLVTEPMEIRDKWWWKIFHVQMRDMRGWLDCDVEFEIEQNGKARVYENDNYRTSSKAPLRIFCSPTKLPRFPDLQLGDFHTHSHYTEDQVEYGSPIPASQLLADAMGLTFFAVTDHSYDLDDRIDNYLENDLNIPKWGMFQKEVNSLNRKMRSVAIIPGEEISCRNSRNQNVHLLLLGSRRFFTGSGDSAEKWFQTRSESSIKEIMSERPGGAVAFASHPLEYVPFLQRLLLGRGQWERDDWERPGLAGLQLFNGSPTDGSGIKRWITILLSGKKLFILAGNDAHGNFNRFRQIGIPFFRITEKDHHVFGRIRTGVFSVSNRPVSILRAIKAGRHIVTDGPVVKMIARSSNETAHIGGELQGEKIKLSLDILSSPEFGPIHSAAIYEGVIGEPEEIGHGIESAGGRYRFRATLPFEAQNPCYFRVEVTTRADHSFDGKSHVCITNPIWVYPSTTKKPRL